jgi:hypothetical protein
MSVHRAVAYRATLLRCLQGRLLTGKGTIRILHDISGTRRPGVRIPCLSRIMIEATIPAHTDPDPLCPQCGFSPLSDIGELVTSPRALLAWYRAAGELLVRIGWPHRR